MTLFSRPTYRTVTTKRRRRFVQDLFAWISLACFALAATPDLRGADASTALEYPKVELHGGVFPIAGDPEMPSRGSKVVVDVTTGAQDRGVNKGLARAARFANLLALGGAKDSRIDIVLHGQATKEALSDKAYSKLFNKPNPNSELIQSLRGAGVRILVCGQARADARRV